MRHYHHKFFAKLFVAVLLALVLLVLGYFTVQPQSSLNPSSGGQFSRVSADEEVRGQGLGRVLGATVFNPLSAEGSEPVDYLRSGPQSKFCAFKIFTDAFPRGEQTVSDSLCGQ